MESFDGEETGNHMDKPSDSDSGSNGNLEAKITELRKTKEELKRAKDNATDSWLDSKPLIDELGRLKSELAIVQNQNSISNDMILELESQLEAIVKDIRTKREEEFRAAKTVNEMNLLLEQTREELEQLKAEKDEERRTRSKLKNTLRLKRQTLRTLQLTLRAMRIESEAFGSSAAKAAQYIDQPETNNSMVELTQEDYYALKRRAKEETSLANWRVSVAMEQKATAEVARDSVLKRLKETRSDKKSRKIKGEGKMVEVEETRQEADELELTTLDVVEVPNEDLALSKARAKEIYRKKQGKPQSMSKSKSRRNTSLKVKKKRSILARMKICFASIKGMFR